MRADEIDLEDDAPLSCAFLTVCHVASEGILGECDLDGEEEDGQVSKIRVEPCPPTEDIPEAIAVELYVDERNLAVQVLIDTGAALELADRIRTAVGYARDMRRGMEN